jgi:hypothetical protein
VAECQNVKLPGKNYFNKMWLSITKAKMAEISTLAKYPFLNASKDYVKDNNLSVSEILDDPLYERARMVGMERIDKSFKDRNAGNRSRIFQT